MTGLVKNILVFKNGKDAYDTLQDMSFKGEKLPEIIFLDINMPIWDGWQFLEEFNLLPINQKIFIHILSSSNNEEDIEKAQGYKMVNNYLIKPIEQNQMKKILIELINF